MNRRFTACLLAALLLAAGHARAAEHHSADGFTNPHVAEAHGGFFSYLRARLFGSDDWASYDPERDGLVPQTQPAHLPPGARSTNATVTWIGHSTVLLQHRGINVLTDPILSQRASPLSFAGPRRRSAAALEVAELPPIDVVVISHDHYDHLDVHTIRTLGDRPRYFVPLGLKTWLINRGINAERITELDWWESESLSLHDTGLEITATPSQHFSGRSLTDRNATLWAAWAIAWDDFQVWFGGDTGYNNVQFKAVGRRFGAFDLGIIPIGAYAPRWFMGSVHVDPADAVRIHQDIGARRSLGVHWGTFELAAEPLLEPPRALAQAVRDAGLAEHAFTTFAVGETRSYPADR